MTTKIVKAGVLLTLIVFASFVLAVGGLGIISLPQQVYARPTSGGTPGPTTTGASGGMGTIGLNGGIGTSGSTCTTPNCNANGVSQNGASGGGGVGPTTTGGGYVVVPIQNGAPGTAGGPGTATGLPWTHFPFH